MFDSNHVQNDFIYQTGGSKLFFINLSDRENSGFENQVDM
jgi:hypothetical protein